VTSQPTVQVVGAKELRKTMKAAGDDLGDLKAVHQAVGNMVVGVARGLAPVRTGALAGSIRTTKAAGGIALKAGSAGIPYAGPIHWGWPARGIKAQPFLSDAATSTEEAWIRFYEEEMDKILEKVEGDS